uniref:Uncharacterized protein n=1 Tax=Ascaris lumbricoides TaxID=6252 RepID=A0A9J2NZ54_ASCLU
MPGNLFETSRTKRHSSSILSSVLIYRVRKWGCVCSIQSTGTISRRVAAFKGRMFSDEYFSRRCPMHVTYFDEDDYYY